MGLETTLKFFLTQKEFQDSVLSKTAFFHLFPIYVVVVVVVVVELVVVVVVEY
jgi:hypothetical protein